MDDVHSTHCAPSVIEDPFFVQVDVVGEFGVCGEVGDDGSDDCSGVVAVLVNGLEGEGVELGWIEDVDFFVGSNAQSKTEERSRDDDP